MGVLVPVGVVGALRRMRARGPLPRCWLEERLSRSSNRTSRSAIVRRSRSMSQWVPDLLAGLGLSRLTVAAGAGAAHAALPGPRHVGFDGERDGDA